MKEQIRSIQPELTMNSNPPTLDVRGDIFMPEPGQGEIVQPESKPTPPKAEITPRVSPQQAEEAWREHYKKQGIDFDTLSADERSTVNLAVQEGRIPTKPSREEIGQFLKGLSEQPEFEEEVRTRAKEIPEQEAVRKRREEAGGVRLYGQLDTKASIFEGIEPPKKLITDEDMRTLGEEGVKKLEAELDTLRHYTQMVERAESEGMLDAERQYYIIQDAVIRGEISPNNAAPYLATLAENAIRTMKERLRRPVPEEINMIEEILEKTDTWEKREGFKKWIKRINPDFVTIDTKYLRAIAEDGEAAEMLLDKIISKPFSAPEDQYRLSFYADINLAGFLTEVNAIDHLRHIDYVRKKEASLRFHEMRRTIISESGNPDAYLSISRSVTPQHLQTATEIQGVEFVRQLKDLAYGRLYSNTERVDDKNFPPEIIDWVTEQFYKAAGYKWNEEKNMWKYEGGETEKSQFLDENGNPRHLEDWEIQRALAFGMNIHSAFYRDSELISWSNIPKSWEEWLKSLPSETVVRVLAGLKFLSYRFRIGATGGGPWFVRLVYDKIQSGFNMLKEKGKITIGKIGKLDIKEDLIPAGFFKGGGFDKGWRTFISYLGSNAMKIKIPQPETFDPEVRKGVEDFINNFGDESTLGFFLIKQEYVAQILASQGAEIEGVELPEQLRYYDPKEQARLVGKVLDPLIDQINISLGVLTSFGAAPENIKIKLWEKVADFLPLRIAYFLSEEGVKGVEGYEGVKGEGNKLFSNEFETKLIIAQRLRFNMQKGNANVKTNLESQERNLLAEAGMTESEIEFVRRLQEFGRRNAGNLARIEFPHIPFLDDVPFQNADYISLGAEVFPRRIGSDWRAYLEGGTGYNNIIGNLAQSWGEIRKHLRTIVDSLGTPEGGITAQNIVLPIVKTYFQLAKQWGGWTRFPGVKFIREFVNLPTSHLQVWFGRNANSWNAAERNSRANDVVADGSIRIEELPGEEKSQMKELLQHTGATWLHVVREQTPGVILFILFAMMWEFFKQVRQGKGPA